ncbi:ribonucleoside hydrolase RihC [Staphylococcus sp. SQ8-PEA]|uniref:Ribonucleoside hydrolase RihC n=1 Tax=Staphylococcus marylandisciuri TaxID=2981529 RepID=A0ABT2QPY5_9STAP|nr:ribonucleoside hydrolase RihC [Staphylococcus marylandisciuri]MCU5746038.1 ribonucleoside hydrolase RihC [Staphylococcus marylandisciuri]
MKHSIIIDTDPGIDDAAAISIALTHPRFDVKMISTVNGNVDIEKTTINALKLKKFFNSKVPVHRGAAQPLMAENVDASEIHGESGMAGYDFEPVEMNELASSRAVDAMRDMLLKSDESITLVPIGPLTNIALLLKTYPEVTPHIKEIVLMGGSAHRGNITPLAEFNIYSDPEAAHIVFESGLPLTMVGLDVARNSTLIHEHVNELRELNNTGEMLYHMFQHYRGDDFEQGINVYDAYTLLYLLYPEEFEVLKAKVQVEVNSELTRGATVTDFSSLHPNTSVVMSINAKRFKERLFESLSYAP